MKSSFTRNVFLALFYVSFVIAILTATESAWAGQLLGTVAVTEAFYGQLISAMIGAIPPTGMLIIALIVLLRGQNQMKVALDGKLDKLMTAEKGVSKAEGIKEEREEERARVAVAPSSPAKVEVVQKDPLSVREIDPPPR